jgi:DNA-directed RNA polymerase I, II, and III subunit RPABC2
MSDIADRLDTQIEDLDIALTEDDVLTDVNEEDAEGVILDEEKDEVHESVNELQSKIIVEDYREILEKIHNNTKKRTLPFITKYEKTRIIGIRAQQLATGSIPLVSVKGFTNTVDIALEELKQKKIPFIIKRVLPDGVMEFWTIDELMIR